MVVGLSLPHAVGTIRPFRESRLQIRNVLAQFSQVCNELCFGFAHVIGQG
jgi:hypothetical protein